MQVKKDEIEERILSAATDEFEQKGYNGASIRRIAKTANVTPGNIYSYYKGKEDIFSRVLSELTDNITLYLNDVSKGMSPNRDTIEYLGVSITKFFLDYKKAFIILMKGSRGTRFENFREVLTRAIANRLQNDYFSFSNTSTDPYMSLIMARSLIEGLFTAFELSGDDEQRLNKLIDNFLKTIFAGDLLIKAGN